MALHVLHVVESLAPEAGSVAISLPGLFAQLRQHDIESEAVSQDRSTGFNPSGLSNASTHVGPPNKPAHLIGQADVLHVHGWGYGLARAASGAARKAGKPYIISPHGALCSTVYQQKRFRDELRALLYENRLIHNAAAVTTLNETEQHELHSRHVNANVMQLPYGIDVSEYETGDGSSCEVQSPGDSGRASSRGSAGGNSPSRAAPEGRFVLMLGPIHPTEGFVPFLRALSEIGPDADAWNVVIAGCEMGDWRKMLEAAIRRKGGEGRVLFASAPDLTTQRAWLARASIVAAPSLQVRFPASIMQAMVTCVPVIASNCIAPNGTEDVIRVCAPTRGDLKVGLRSLFAMSDEDRVAMGRRARDVSRNLLSWSIIAEPYVRLYRSLA